MKKITIDDIAEKVGVSKATVSLVLNGSNKVAEETKQKVLEIINKYNFRPNYFARKLSSQSYKFSEVAMIVTRVSSVFVQSIVSNIEEYLYKKGFFDIRLNMFCTLNNVELKEILLQKLVYENLVDGIIIVTVKPSDEIVKFCEKFNIPLITIENYYPNTYSITVDNDLGVRLALNRLKEIGKKRVAIVVGALKPLEGEDYNFTAIERYESIKNWFLENQDIKLVAEHFVYGYQYEEGYQIADELVEKKVDAIFSAAGDLVASGIISRLHELKIKIPQEIAVIGYDNNLVVCRSTYPKLTTIDQNLSKVGKIVVDLLRSFYLNDNLNKKLHFEIKPKLIIRESA